MSRRNRVYALSIKQPWAALIVHGIKKVEVRRWHTHKRGRILIHTGRIADDRQYGWELVPPEAAETAKLRGGIIGAANLVKCVNYEEKDDFCADCRHHLNDPDWFLPPRLYGFVFDEPALLPFREFTGNVRFFTVPAEVANSQGNP